MMMRLLCQFAVALAMLSSVHIHHLVECISHDTPSLRQHDRCHSVANVNYGTEADFQKQKELIQTYHLSRGQKLRFKCGGQSTDGKQEIRMYPKNPLDTVLPIPMDYSEADALKRAIPRRYIYRSNEQFIFKAHPRRTNEVISIRYPKEGVIFGKDPENFSLYFACVMRPKDGKVKGNSIIRWLRVVYEDVFPLSYGCESPHTTVFQNSKNVDEKHLYREQTCFVNPQPKMTIGIYCNIGERLEPPGCIPDDRLARDGKGLTRYMPKHSTSDPSAPDLATRLALFRVPDEGIDSTIFLSCHCINASGENTSTLVIDKLLNTAADFSNGIRYGSLGKQQQTYHNLQFMNPGRRYNFYVPLDGQMLLDNGEKVTTELLPEDKGDNEIFVGAPDLESRGIALKQVVGAKGFTINKSVENQTMMISVKYDRDAVVVMKSNSLTLYYLVRMLREGLNRRIQSHISIEMNIIPTDPYTYGCGVDSRDLFHTDLSAIHDVYENHKLQSTECTINAHLVSPIGFYCPKGYTLDPPNCFKQMILDSTGAVVPTLSYLPYARVIEGNHIRILDTSLPKNKQYAMERAVEKLVCHCVDPQGVTRASIKVDLRQWSPSDMEFIYGKPADNKIGDL